MSPSMRTSMSPSTVLLYGSLSASAWLSWMIHHCCQLKQINRKLQPSLNLRATFPLMSTMILLCWTPKIKKSIIHCDTAAPRETCTTRKHFYLIRINAHVK